MKKFVVLSVFLTVIGLMIVPLTSIQFSNAASVLVVPTQFPTIQAAINAAGSGNTVKILPGTYSEQLTINKNLILIGSGPKSTIIKASATLKTGITGNPYVIEVGHGAIVSMKGFTLRGIDGINCGTSDDDGLIGISVQETATIRTDTIVIRDCTFDAVLIGEPPSHSGGPQVGHAIIIRTDIDGYQFSGIEAFTEGSTLAVTRSKFTAAENPETLSPTGIASVAGAKSIITYNKVTGNICNDPDCGPDYLTQFQGFGILLASSAEGTIVSNNDLSNNDVGIGTIGGNDCCKIHDNSLRDNRFFGIVIQDGKQTSSKDKISGGNVGVASVSFGDKTIATLVNDKITGTKTPTEELSCCGGTAEIVTVPPGGFKVSQSQVDIKSSQAHKLMEKKIGR